jgi:Ni/Co efflux regulator RcnB
MKLKAVVCAVIALTMASANIAIAQGKGDRGDKGGRGDHGDKGDRRAEQRHDNDRHDMGRRGPPSWANNRHDAPRDYGRRWNRGDRLPPQYRDRQYIVNDWRGHHLSAPPRGYYWVQNGSDYLLVAVATGIIAQLLLNR